MFFPFGQRPLVPRPCRGGERGGVSDIGERRYKQTCVDKKHSPHPGPSPSGAGNFQPDFNIVLSILVCLIIYNCQKKHYFFLCFYLYFRNKLYLCSVKTFPKWKTFWNTNRKKFPKTGNFVDQRSIIKSNLNNNILIKKYDGK